MESSSQVLGIDVGSVSIHIVVIGDERSEAMSVSIN